MNKAFAIIIIVLLTSASFAFAQEQKPTQPAPPSKEELKRFEFAMQDLNVNAEDVTGTVKDGIYGKDFRIIATPGTFSIIRGPIDNRGEPIGTYAHEQYAVENEKKSLLIYQEYTNNKPTLDITYRPDKWQVVTYDEQGNDRRAIYEIKTFNNKNQLVLGTIEGITAVKDPVTGNVRYYKDAKTEASSDDLKKLGKEGQEQLEKLEKDSETLDPYIGKKQELELLPEERERRLTDVVMYFRAYSGLAGWSSLIFDEEFLADWRKGVNEFFCSTIVLGGIDCWASKICGAYSDITAPRNGVLFSTPVGGAPRAVAHIEAQRSLPIITPNATSYGYTITFGIANPSDEPLTYNVRFIGSQRSPTWWAAPQSIGKNGRVSALGASALYKVTPNDYTTVCLEFNPALPSFDGGRVSRLCNDIVQYAGGASAPYQVVTAQQGAAPTPSAPAGQAPGASV